MRYSKLGICLEEPIRLPVPPSLMSLSMCLSVHLSVQNFKERRFQSGNEKYGFHVESSVCCPSPPTANSYVQEKKLGSSSKFVENYVFFLCISIQICALHRCSMGWRNLCKTAGKTFIHHMCSKSLFTCITDQIFALH
jgi:hypothetical protein